ncbi:hypothetical protein [Rhodococcus chondri]|uniref:Uncharacterized protein n=1 Tax=Rhodococcus chondri TaxID=3065941 RepID=A0ABU7JUT9_9NOCA|nr:hypothetical protein [Rhodococcus sp. CC-R104]MEE2033625.1 hypothetical protein [Rhodococcus sp. CC-R104]
MKQFLIFFAALMILGLVVEYWRILVVLIVVLALVAAAVPVAAMIRDAAKRTLEAERDRDDRARAERSRLAARAKTQHEWYLEGDARGIYGAYPPADLDTL